MQNHLGGEQCDRDQWSSATSATHMITSVCQQLPFRSDAIANWINENIPEAGRVTGTSSMGSSGWASSSVYTTASGQQFFVKQVTAGAVDGIALGPVG